MASESRSVTDTASLLVSKGLNVLLIIHKVSNRVNLANPLMLSPLHSAYAHPFANKTFHIRHFRYVGRITESVVNGFY